MVGLPNSVPDAFGVELRLGRVVESQAGQTQFDHHRPRPNRTRRSVEFARHLRRYMTDPARVLWRVLRNRWFSELEFRRQHSFPPDVLDFVCIERKLIVELDGGSHALTKHRDAQRDAFFAAHEFTTLRIAINDLYQRRDDVLNAIWVAAYGQPKHFPPIQLGEILRYT